MDIKKEVDNIFDRVVAWRRDFHRHPELAHQEERTASIVAAHLKNLGMSVREHVGSTGVIGVLKGAEAGKTIALRADMDALPIVENTGFDFSSENSGVMHACGHDANVSMLMATAEILAQHRDELRGTVKFIFQPAEEGGHGAHMMVENGALENPKPDAIIATHLFFWESGTVTIRKGYAFLASDTFRIKLHGRGGHGAKPHESVDTLLAGCKVVTDLQMIISRKISPQDTGTVSVGSIHSGCRENIIADSCEICGTIRTLRPEVRTAIEKGLHEICDGVCAQLGTTYELELSPVCTEVYNDPKLMEMIESAAKSVLGHEKVFEAELSRPGSEDFSEYLKTGIPGGYFWLGGAYPGEKVPSQNHQPTYNWDEQTMRAGIATEVASVLSFLNNVPGGHD